MVAVHIVKKFCFCLSVSLKYVEHTVHYKAMLLKARYVGASQHQDLPVCSSYLIVLF